LGEHDGGGAEGKIEARALQEWAEEAAATEREQEGNTGHGGRHHERDFDQRFEETLAGESVASEEIGQRCGENEHEDDATQRREETEDERVMDDGARGVVPQFGDRHTQEERQDGQREEGDGHGHEQANAEHGGKVAGAWGGSGWIGGFGGW
jgi:hypothetical protein